MKRCKHIEADGFHHCSSYAFNLYKEDIDQGDLCDVHYWQDQAQKARADEREACAKVCDDWPNGRDDVYSIGVAIRARGDT